MNRRRSFSTGALSGILLGLALSAIGADRFDDLIVAPLATAQGETFHGYREYRIALENVSASTTHSVTLVYPERPYEYGNSITRISRTVSIGPLSRLVVPVWQPPLPINGNGMVGVLVDDQMVGMVNLPGGSQHMSRPGRGGGVEAPATVLISRSLNFEEASRVLKAEVSRSAFSAAAATGPPDAGGGRGFSGAAWMPEPSRSGPHWLELDYDPAFPADHVRVHESLGALPTGEIILTGVSGTNIARIAITPPARPRRGTMEEFTFPLTTEPVKTVRLEFSSTFGSIGIDAVELVGPTNSAWAANARASSESTMMMPSSAMPGADSRALLRSEIPVTEWSDSWLAYSPFDGVAISASDLRSAPSGVLDALWRYTECGGNLFVLGGGEVPEPWRSLEKGRPGNGPGFTVGFGRCFVTEADRFNQLKPSVAGAMIEALRNSARYWQSLPDENSANVSFPVIDSVGVPVRGMVFMMLGFVILIGPVNLIVLSRLKKRTWLLWTIPSISFVTCLLVFVYSLLREGVTPDARIEGFTVLDQVNSRASSVGTTAFYSPLTPSRGLFFGPDTEATPLVSVWERSSSQRRQVDWTQSQHFERGWITARVAVHFRLRKSEVRRERLQLETSGGQISVVNGLGATIRTLTLADSSGRIYTSQNIPAGQKANLLPIGERPKSTDRSGLHSFLEKPGTEPLEDATLAAAPDWLVPNTYVAELETTPFLENGLGPKAKSSRTKTRSLIYGILGSPK